MNREERKSGFQRWAREHLLSEEHLLEEEKRRLAERRAMLTSAGLNVRGASAGLALSGGGQRSATFSLGLLRELAAHRLLHRFDYLSTVSGGSYIGAYYCALFSPRHTPEGSKLPALSTGDFVDPTGAGLIADPFSSSASNDAPRSSLDWLRQSGRYLAPSGAGDYWHALGLLVRNWFGLHFVIGVTVMLCALLGVACRLLIYGSPGLSPLPLSRAIVFYAPLLLLLAVPVGIHATFAWAYWLTKRDVARGLRGITTAQVGTAVVGIVGTALGLGYEPTIDNVHIEWNRTLASVLGGIALFSLATVATARYLSSGGASREERWDQCRAKLTRPMRFCAGAAAVIVCAAFIDAIGFLLYRRWMLGFSVAIVLPPAAAAAGVPAARALASRLAQLSGTVPRPNRETVATLAKRPRDAWLKIAGGLLAVALILGVLLAWTSLAYKATWPTISTAADRAEAVCSSWRKPSPLVDAWLGCGTAGHWCSLWTVWLGWSLSLGFISAVIARTPTFLNLSALTAFYAGRLRRAYLGAGNRTRHNPESGNARKPVLDQWDAADDVLFSDYYPTTPTAAPMHLINVALNETRGLGSNIVQRDRRGRNLVVSPFGIYCDAERRGDLYRIPLDGDQQEQLPLSSWIAVSGAAFSTGLGNRTGFPLTQLAGLANLRLGYWWRVRARGLRWRTQWDLLREFRGDFSGPYGKLWYLSDGGHFENTGAYELIRRRISFIVVSDNGMDERFEYEDMANLVRKARIDFGCEIEFVGSKDLDLLFASNPIMRRSFGTLSQIAGDDPTSDKAVAALARLRYSDGSAGTLLLIKPRLTGDGPADLVRYKASNNAFPQETTLDQSFDEAQWESYYYLGRLIAQSVFGGSGTGSPTPASVPGWTPGTFTSLF